MMYVSYPYGYSVTEGETLIGARHTHRYSEVLDFFQETTTHSNQNQTLPSTEDPSQLQIQANILNDADLMPDFSTLVDTSKLGGMDFLVDGPMDYA